MELTGMVHGKEEAERAREASRALFVGAGGDTAAMPSAELPAEFGASAPLVELFASSALCSSKSEARRLIEQGGAWLNGRVRTDVYEEVSLTAVDELVLRAGKKRFFRFRPRSER